MTATYKCCNGCVYWRPMSPSSGGPCGSYCCHHLLVTGRRCGRTGDECNTRRKEK